MKFSKQAVLKRLATFTVPDSEHDVVSAGHIGDIQFAERKLRLMLKINPDAATGFNALLPKLKADLQSAFDDVDHVQVLLTAHRAAPQIQTTQKAQTAMGRKPVRPHQARRPDGYQGDAFIKRKIAISSAKGGVGKSTMAVNLAVALSKSGLSIGLLDADIHGPSLPMLVGEHGRIADTREVQGRKLIAPIEAHGLKTMSIGYLTPGDGPIVWRGPMVQGAMSRMLWDVDWGELDVLLIDMPPGTGDPQLGLAQDIKPDGAVIISTPQDLALLDARKGVAMFEKVDIPVLGLIENMALFTCPDCGAEHAIFGAGGAKRDAETLQIDYLGAAPLHMDIRQSGDLGHPIAAQDSANAKVFEHLAGLVRAAFERPT